MSRQARGYPRTRGLPLLIPAIILPILLCTASLGMEGGKVSAAPARPGTLRLSFVGDILLAGTVGELIQAEGPLAPWQAVKDLLSAADVTVGNLECAVGTTGTAVEGKTYTFRADPKALKGLAESGFDVVSLANNHTLDFGTECLLESVREVRKAGLVPIGAGANEVEARKPYTIERNGIKVGILATAATVPHESWAASKDTPGLAVDYEAWYPGIVASIRELSKTVDVVIVVIHWGDERVTVPASWIASMHKAMKQAGAHAVIGSHPHVLEGMYYDGRTLTAYSLGNFVFSTRPEIPACQEGVILNLTVSKGKVDAASVVPTRIVWGKTIPAAGTDRDATIANLSSLSRPMGTDLDPYGNVVPLLFTDMNDHWARFTVGQLAVVGSVQGYEDGTFRPDATIKKAEFAALFSRAVASSGEVAAATEPQGFVLSARDHWGYPYLKYLASRTFVSPTDPNWTAEKLCSRLDACQVMWKHSGSSGTSAEAWARLNGIFKGDPNGDLRLGDTITRAEMAEVLWRYLSAR